MNFDKTCMIFTMQEPFYGILLSSMERVPTKQIPTMGVMQYGNVFRLLYNPDFVEQFSLDTMIELLKHEVLHVAFHHFTLWENRADKEEESLRNIACDLEVNSYLNENHLAPAKPMLPSQFKWEKQAGSLEYHRRLHDLLNQHKQKQQAQTPQKPCNGGQGGQQPPQNSQQNQPQQQQEQQEPQQGQAGNPDDAQQKTQSERMMEDYCDACGQKLGEQFDDHTQWPDSESQAAAQIMDQAIDELLVFAADEVEKNCGDIPGEMRQRVEVLRKKARPVADWRRYVRRYMGNEFSEVVRKSRKRESRRFPDAAGNRKRRKSKILVAIDTSGSVSMPEYQEFLGQIKTMRDHTEVHVVECDACIQYEYDFTGKIPTDLHGGGGTSFQPVVDYFLERRKLYDALIYFTDGYCDVPSNTPKETLWVISSQGVKDRKPFTVNGASVVMIPPKQTD